MAVNSGAQAALHTGERLDVGTMRAMPQDWTDLDELRAATSGIPADKRREVLALLRARVDGDTTDTKKGSYIA